MKPKRWVWALLGTLLALAVGSYGYLASSGISVGAAQGSNPNSTAVPQAVARRGELTVSVNGSGELVPFRISELGFDLPGTLLDISVTPGDQVKAGDVLALLKIDKTPAEHQADLASAKLAVVQAQQNLDQLVAHADLEAAQALNDLETSQTALEDLNHPDMRRAQAMQTIAKAGQEVATAEMNLYILQSMPSQEAINIANASLLFKQKEYQDTQKSIARLENQIRSALNETIRDRLEDQLIRTQITLAKQMIEVDEASHKLASMGAPPDPDSITRAEVQLATAQAELAQAQRDLETALAGPSPADLAAAQARVAEARAALERLKDGPDPLSLAQAKSRLAEAQAKLALIEQEELVRELKAPFDSTVLAVDARPGDRVQKATVITVADLSPSIVKVNVDETDLTDIQIGLEAQVVFDALPEVAFTGQVVQIDPSLQRSGNTYAANVWVSLDQQDAHTTIDMPLGLNASVDILIGKASNTILVPVEAIHELENGTTVVYVIQDNRPEQRLVTVGLMDLTSAAITSGLQAGEIVTTGPVD